MSKALSNKINLYSTSSYDQPNIKTENCIHPESFVFICQHCGEINTLTLFRMAFDQSCCFLKKLTGDTAEEIEDI